MSARRHQPPSLSRRALPATYLLSAAALLVVLNVLGAVLPHSPATWAIAHPQRLPVWAHIFLAIVGTGVLALVATVALRPATVTSRALGVLRSPASWAALLVVLTFLVPNTVPYGDAVRFYRFVPSATGPEPNAPLSFEAHRLLAGLFPRHLVAAFSSLSLLGGLLAIPAFFRLSRSLFPQPGEEARRGLFLMGMAGSTIWQLYLGYVEHYHVQLALIVWGLAFLFGGRVTAGAACIGLSAAWNLSAAWLLPAIALGFSAHALVVALVPIALTLVLITALHGPSAVASAYAGGFHPLASANAGFVPLGELLSRGHILFLVNEALLVAPLAVALAPGLAVTGGWRTRSPRDDAGHPGRLRRLGARGLLLIASLAFVLLWNPRLGFSRDWDLFAWSFCIMQVLALEAALRAEPDAPRARAWAPVLASAQGLALVYVLSNSRFGR